MEKIVFEKPEDAISRMHTGNREEDLNTVNAILSGTYSIGTEEVEEPVVEEEVAEQEDIDEPQVVEEPVVSRDYDAEEEAHKQYIEMIERRNKEEKEELLRSVRAKEEEAERERKVREDLEKRIQEIDARQQNAPSQSQLDEEVEDEFISDYNKKTRNMVEDLKRDIGSSPELQKLYEKINTIEQSFESEAKRRKEEADREKRQAEVSKVFQTIRKFSTEHPEFSTEKDIEKLDQDYQTFRKDLAYLVQAKSNEDLEEAISDYRSGGRVKELADSNGIRYTKDFEKYEALADLLDFKDGVKYDPVLKKRVSITDDKGVQVRYRSLEEAYNIKNYYENMTNAKRQAFKEVSKKFSEIDSAPVTLKPEHTSTVSTGLTLDQEREYINMNPKEWENNPEKLAIAKAVFAKRGLELPKYRGRKF